MIRKFKECDLYTDCLTALNPELFSGEESDIIHELFKALYPITDWGRIDWTAIKIKNEIQYLNDIIPSLERILKIKLDENVYIELSDGGFPLVKANLNVIINNFHHVDCLASHKFIFNPSQGYIIEILFSGKVTIGCVEKKRIIACSHLKDFLYALSGKKFRNKYHNARWIRKLLNPFSQPNYFNIHEPNYIQSASDIIPSIQSRLEQPVKKEVLLMWEDTYYPIIETDLEKIISLWDLLVTINIPFKLIALDSSYSIDAGTGCNEIKIIVNSGLKSK